MLLGAEIGLLIYGIIVLVNGKFSLGKDRKLYGGYARVLGVICMLPMPLAFMIGFVIGFVSAIQGKQMENMFAYAFVDLGLLALTVVLVVVLGNAFYARQQRREEEARSSLEMPSPLRHDQDPTNPFSPTSNRWE